MAPAVIAALISAASTLYGTAKSAQAARGANKKLDEQQRENRQWFDRRYNEDPLQRSSALRLLNYTQEQLRQRNKEAAGHAAVMGGTEESVAAEKARNSNTMAETASRLAAANDARNDSVEQQYMSTKHGLDSQQMQAEQQRAQNIAQATAGIGTAAGNLASPFSTKTPDNQIPAEVPKEITDAVNEAKNARIKYKPKF